MDKCINTLLGNYFTCSKYYQNTKIISKNHRRIYLLNQKIKRKKKHKNKNKTIQKKTDLLRVKAQRSLMHSLSRNQKKDLPYRNRRTVIHNKIIYVCIDTYAFNITTDKIRIK